MFATIRKHQTWLWAVIIGAVIVSFVIYFTPTGRQGGGYGPTGSLGTINGHPISRKQYAEAQVEAQLTFLIRYGSWPDKVEADKFEFNLDREVRNRLVILEKLKDLGIQVDESAVANWVIEKFTDRNRPGSAGANYAAFVRQRLPRYGISEALFERFVRHEVGIVHLVAVAGLPGQLITPREAQELYRQEHEQIEAEAVLFSSTNFLARVRVEPGALGQFYTNRESLYRIPDQVRVSYVRFDPTNYLAQAEAVLAKISNLDAQIDAKYQSSRPEYYVDAEGHVMPPELAKQRIRREATEGQALLLARKAAALFGTALAEVQPAKAQNLDTLAAASNLTVKVTAPFDEYGGPAGLKAPESFTKTAFLLTPSDPLSPTPLVGEDGVYLIALKERLPSRLPRLDSIRPRVLGEFYQTRATELAREAATNFAMALTNGLAQGKHFAELCRAQNVIPTPLPRFSLSTQSLPDLDPRLDLDRLKAAVSGLAAGKASGLKLTRDGATILYVKTRIPVADSELAQALPKFLTDLRDSQQFAAFNEWFRRQAELTRVRTTTGRDQAE